MLLSLLFSSLASQSRVPTTIGGLVLDVTFEEEHRLSSDVTDHPVEGGGTIQDHVVLSPRMLKISGFVTDTPLVASGLPLGSLRTSAAFAMLEQLWLARIPFIVITQLRVYPSMVIDRLSVPRNSREGSVRFECTFKEITTVSSQNTTIPASSSTPSTSEQATSNGGGIGNLTPQNVSQPSVDSVAVDVGRPAQNVVPVPETPQVVPEVNRSWLYSLTVGD